MACWETSWVFRFWETTIMGRSGNRDESSAARKGWAAGLTASKDKDSPFSTHSRRACTAGDDATTENKSTVDETDGFMPTSKAGPGWGKIQGGLLLEHNFVACPRKNCLNFAQTEHYWHERIPPYRQHHPLSTPPG